MFDNSVRLVGFVRLAPARKGICSDVELKTTKTQRECTVLSLETTASWKDKNQRPRPLSNGILLAQVKRHCTHYFVSTRGSPITVSVQGALELCQNCAKTLSNCDVGVYFEREADSPKLLKTLERQNKGRNRWNGCACLQSRCSRGALVQIIKNS
jgi:hypothetical protein